MHQEQGEKQQREDDDDRQDFEAQAGNDGEGDHGAQGKSQVAPDAKHRHAGGQVLAGKIVGGFITFGMIRRHPEAADHHQQQHETIVARGRQQRQTQAGGETPEGKQDELLLLVGKITEYRLHDGGSEICRHQNDAGQGIRQGKPGLQEGQEGGQGALIDIGDQMPEGEDQKNFQVHLRGA